MTVYKIQADNEHYKAFDLDIEEIFDKLGEDFDFNFPCLGISVKEKWQTLSSGKYVPIPEYEHATKIPDISDWQSGDLVFSGKACDLLYKHLADYGEFLPVKCDDQNCHIFNVLNIMDVVDVENSAQILDQGVFMGIKKLSFKEGLLTDTLLFKIKYDNLHNIYCTDAFKTLIEKSGLTGLIFTEDLASV